MCRATRSSSQVTIFLNNQRVIPFYNLRFIKDYQNEENKDVQFQQNKKKYSNKGNSCIHGTIIRTGITCKRTPCYLLLKMRKSYVKGRLMQI